MSRRPPAPRRIVGVLGGMGPLATADFYLKIIRATPAAVDQDHLHVLIDSNPEIPDRTEGIEGRGPDPTPALVGSAARLVGMGAELLAMPCNSAHAYLTPIRAAAGVPVLDMMAETAAALAARTPRPGIAGLLATTGTLRQRLYHAALLARGVAVLEPDPAAQAELMAVIYDGVKAGDTGPAVRDRVRAVSRGLVSRGAAVLILGCTELPLVLGPEDASVPVLDATEILARAVVREAAGEYPAASARSANIAAGST